jgi:hypothetical protein
MRMKLKGPTSEPGVSCCFQSSQCWTFTWTTCSEFIDHNPLENWWPAFRRRSIYSISNLLSSTGVSISKGLCNPTCTCPSRSISHKESGQRWQQTVTCTTWRLSSSGVFLTSSNTFLTSGIQGASQRLSKGLRSRNITHEGCYRLDLTLLSTCRERRFSSQCLPLRQTLG